MRRAIAAAKLRAGTVDPADKRVVTTIAEVVRVSGMSVDERK